MLNNPLTDVRPAADAWPALASGWRRGALAAWVAALATVAVFSLTPGLGPPSAYALDKLFHGASYLALALLPHAGLAGRKTAFYAALAMIPLGCALEVAQHFVPGRFFDPWDAVANSVGAVAGVALGARFRQLVAALTAASAR